MFSTNLIITSFSKNNVLSSITDGWLRNLKLIPKKSPLLKIFGPVEEIWDHQLSILSTDWNSEIWSSCNTSTIMKAIMTNCLSKLLTSALGWKESHGLSMDQLPATPKSSTTLSPSSTKPCKSRWTMKSGENSDHTLLDLILISLKTLKRHGKMFQNLLTSQFRQSKKPSNLSRNSSSF